MTSQPIQQSANKGYASRFDAETRELIATATDHNSNRYDEALEELGEQPLSVDKIATCRREGQVEWEILLGTGGPADRIVVRTTLDGAVESADYQFRNWFEPWTSAERQDEQLVRRYAEIVGYFE